MMAGKTDEEETIETYAATGPNIVNKHPLWERKGLPGDNMQRY